MNDSVSPGQNAIEALLQGVRSFREREYGEPGALMPGLSGGQQPGAMMIACADSRVDPALIFGARPGDLLVVRVVANLVPPPDTDSLDSGVMSAVELGLKALGIQHLIVCGHSGCAGVRTALDEALHDVVPDDYCLHEWTTVAVPACQEVIAAHGDVSADELARHAEQRSVLKSLENLRAHPWVQNLETSGKLTLHGWWFDIATGDLWIADSQTGVFSAF